MDKLKVIKIEEESIKFDNGLELGSDHESRCCESHYLSFKDLTLDDFKDLEFNLSNDDFFKRIKDYGIELIPIKGHSIKVPGYGFNNGYYSEQLDLVIYKDYKIVKKFNITDCQVVEG